jgi:hypothetical protein
MRDRDPQSESSRSTLQQLADAIEAAVHLTEALAADPTLQRLLEAFRLMPLEDRGTILRAIEREVQARRLSNATEGATGHSMHANPNARLYLRSHERVTAPKIVESDDFMLAMLSAMRVSSILLIPSVHKAWTEGTREAIEHLDDDARASVAQLLRESLDMLEQAMASGASGRRAARAS